MKQTPSRGVFLWLYSIVLVSREINGLPVDSLSVRVGWYAVIRGAVYGLQEDHAQRGLVESWLTTGEKMERPQSLAL